MCSQARTFTSLLAILLSLSGAGLSFSQEQASTRYEVSAASLSHHDFRVRQQAYKALADAGAAAVPAVVTAAQRGNRETRDRAISLLLAASLSRQKEASQAGERALVQLAAAQDEQLTRAVRGALEELKGSKVLRAIDRIQALGGTVTSATGVDLDPEGPFAVQINDKWTGGDEGLSLVVDLGNVSWLSLESSPVTAAGLVHVSRLTRLEHLYLGFSRITGDGLASLGTLPRLSNISLRGLAIRDADLAKLPELPQLQSLGLDDTQIGDESLVHLAKYPSVTRLWLNGTKVTDKGLIHLQKIPALETLYLEHTSAVGPGLADLKGLSNLRHLSLKRTTLRPNTLSHVAQLNQLEVLGLEDTNVTDDQLAELAALKHLRTLWLSKTAVTDRAVPHLIKLKSLQNLYMHGSQLSEAGAEKVREALPDCNVGR